jgi:uncharacterized membrane protein (UPF0127 family)
MSMPHGHGMCAATPVQLRWRFARGFVARLRGLLGRSPPVPGAALLIAPCRAVHTVGMRYPIDIVFLARDGRVLRVCPQVVPVRARVCRRAWGVAELAAGQASRLDIVAGTTLALPPDMTPTAKSRRDR